MEDELGSMAVILGASVAGKRSMTATYGPGLSLIMENIGLGVMLELPAVIIDVQRGGPSTGLPTMPGQGDVMQARWGSHGGYEIVAYAPWSPQVLGLPTRDGWRSCPTWLPARPRQPGMRID